MKTTRNRVIIDSYPVQTPPYSESATIKSIKKGANSISDFSTLLKKMFMLCSLAMIIFTSCEKTDELTPSPSSTDTIRMDKSVTVASYYIAPNGSDAASGDITHPFATLNKAWSKVVAGDLVFMRGGTYQISTVQNLTNKSGTAGNLIKFWAYPGEVPKIIPGPGFSNIHGIHMQNIAYVHLKGIEICGFKQTSGSALYYGIFGYDVNNSIFEMLDIHHNGFGLGIGSANGNSLNNLFLNCDFHHNSDPLTTISGMNKYGGADGLAMRSTGNGTNTLDGCRLYWNSDDGLDPYFNEGTLIIKNCWAFMNGYRPGINVGDPDQKVTGGNGNGLKMGPLYNNANRSTETLRYVTNCVTFENRATGFDQNDAKCKFVFHNNTAYKNVGLGFHVGYNSPGEASTFKNNIAYNNNNNSGSTTQINWWNNSLWVLSNNNFLGGTSGDPNSAFNVTDADFVSINSSAMTGARQSDGSLPVNTFLHTTATSDLVNKGVNVGLPFSGTAPDLGAFEYGGGTSVNNPPTMQNQSFSMNKNSPNGTAVGTVVATDPDAGQTLTYSIQSGNTNGAFAINASTGAITVANAVAFGNSTTGTKYSVFSTATPSISQNYKGTGSAPVEVGMKFRSNANGFVSGFRYYKGSGAQGTHIGNLWSINGTKLASATFTGETASGWQTATLSTPVAITANTIYVVSYFSQHGDYVKTNPYFKANVVNGPLTALGWTAAQPNGVYRYSATSAFPNNNAYIGNTNFWADVIFSTTSSSVSAFTLVVKVQDNGTGSLSNQANITINLI